MVLVGLEAVAVFTFSNINGAQVGMAAGVDFNVSLGVLSCGLLMVVLLIMRVLLGVVLLAVVFLVLETGTAVTFFFTRNPDLLLAVMMLSTRGNFSGSSERRVVTFPSGRFLAGKFDL